MKRQKTSRLTSKILRLFLIMEALFLVISLLVVGVYFGNIYREHEMSSLENDYQLSKTSLENMVNEYYSSAILLSDSAEIQEALTGEVTDMRDQYTLMLDLQTLLSEFSSALDVYQISLYVKDDYFFTSNNSQFRSLSELYQYSEFETFSAGPAFIQWLPAEELVEGETSKNVPVISFLRKLGTRKNPIGYAQICIRLKDLKGMIDNLPSEKGFFACLYDKNTGSMITSSQETYYPEDTRQPLGEEAVSLLKKDDWSEVTMEGTRYQAYASVIKSTDWVYLIMVPQNYLAVDIGKLMVIWIPLALIFTFLFGIFLSRFSGDFTRRILHLEENMEKVKQGDMRPEAYDPGQKPDEIDQLIDDFEIMKRDLWSLMKEKARQSEQLRRQELKVLQEQINPHFLYNTLDMVHWKALDAHQQEISDIISTLARYYRQSLGSGKEAVTLKHELHHVIYYVDIQNHRYQNIFHLDIDVDEEYRDYILPKITLQPIVENAITHGLLEVKDKNAKRLAVTISAYEDSEEILCICVEDNGVGMSREKLDSLFTGPLSAEQKHGYGMRNVNDRLKLYYGQDCGLTVESQEGKGTCVTVRIRMNREEEEEI